MNGCRSRGDRCSLVGRGSRRIHDYDEVTAAFPLSNIATPLNRRAMAYRGPRLGASTGLGNPLVPVPALWPCANRGHFRSLALPKSSP